VRWCWGVALIPAEWLAPADAGLVRLRLVNAGSARYYDIVLEGAQMHLIGLDAALLDTGQPEAAAHLARWWIGPKRVESLANIGLLWWVWDNRNVAAEAGRVGVDPESCAITLGNDGEASARCRVDLQGRVRGAVPGRALRGDLPARQGSSALRRRALVCPGLRDACRQPRSAANTKPRRRTACQCCRPDNQQ
jgi:hypothetical protein